MPSLRSDLKAALYHYAVAMGTIAIVVIVYRRLPDVNPTTVALTFLLVVLGVASRWGLTVATTTAVVATLAFNYFFLPPVHTFTIADPQNWIALLAFLISAILASRLSERARREALNATRRRKEVERLYCPEPAVAGHGQCDGAAQLHSPLRARCLRPEGGGDVSCPSARRSTAPGVDHPELSEEQLESVSGRGELVVDEEQQLCFVPLRIGVRPVGSLGLEGAVLSRETLEAVGSLIAISIERAGAVETLTRAEATRESEKLRSALLDSVTHEFRTPLTSIKLSVTTLLSTPEIDADETKGPAHRHQRRDRPAQPSGGRGGGDGAARCAASGIAPRVAFRPRGGRSRAGKVEAGAGGPRSQSANSRELAAGSG